MKQHFSLFPLFVAMLLLADCVSAPPSGSAASTVNTRAIAIEKLGSGVQCTRNSRGDMDVCVKEQKQVDSPTVSFMVLATTDGSVIMDVFTVNGAVEWYNDTQLKIQDRPGFVPENDDPATNYYLYDVLKRERIEGKKL